MKFIPSSYILFLALFFSTIDKANAQSLEWAISLGNENSEYTTSIAVDAGNGDVYTTGFFYGLIDFDPGPDTFNLASGGYNSCFISKLDSLGNFVWARAMIGLLPYTYSGVAGNSIALDTAGSGAVYTTGIFWGEVDFDPGPDTFLLTSVDVADIFISKLDGAGNFVWAKAIGGVGSNYDVGNSIATDPAGSGAVYTAGSFYGTVDFDPGPGIFNLNGPGIFVSKLDSAGNFVWAKSIQSIEVYSSYPSIALDPAGSGGVYTAGSFGGTVDFDPGPGIFNLAGPGIFVSKLDFSGNFVWAKSMTGYGDGHATSIAIVPGGNGDVYTTGYFNGTLDFDPGAGTFNLAGGYEDIFISRLDFSGNFVWAKAMTAGGGGGGSGRANSIATDAFENVYTTGYFNGTVDFDPNEGIFNLSGAGSNLFISKLDSSGNFEWAISSVNVAANVVGESIAIDATGMVHVTGLFFDGPSIWFNCANLTNHETVCLFCNEEGECYLYPCYLVDIFIVQLDGNAPPLPSLVTNTNDSGPGSLRELITCSPSGSTITFDSALLDQTITLTSGEIHTDKDLTISGLGMLDLTISGNNTSWIFSMYLNNLEIENLSLTNAGGYYGGAIYVNGNLILENVLLQNNFGNGIPKAMTIAPEAVVGILGNVEIKY